MNSRFGIWLLLALFTGALSATQAWALTGTSPRVLRYAVAWIVCTAFIAFTGHYFLWEGKSDPSGRGVAAIRISAGIIVAVAFIAGGFVAKKRIRGASWTDTAAGLLGVHFAVALVGGGIALATVAMVALANANW